LLDSELLAEVYMELLGGRQRGLAMEEEKKTQANKSVAPILKSNHFVSQENLRLAMMSWLRMIRCEKI